MAQPHAFAIRLSPNAYLKVRRPLLSDKDRLMAFCYVDSSLAVMPIKTLFLNQSNETHQIIFGLCYKILDLILLSYKDTPEDLKFLWESFLGYHDDKYFLLTNELDTPESNWRLYSYAYFRFVNENKFERPTILDYNRDILSTSLQYNSTNQYEQYFDVYNVMSESKYADDVLSRFLRMYQILEYMAYRRLLADMTKGNIKENGFVRNVINKASKGATKELEEIKNGMRGVLPDLNTIIPQNMITQDMKDFITNRLLISANHDNGALWKVVYQLRNNIVHNKESELHFMYANATVYEQGIKLMKLFIEKIEPAIVDVVNNPSNKSLEFDQQTVRVF